MNWIQCLRHQIAVQRIVRNASHKQLGAESLAATIYVMHLLDTLRYQRSSGAAKPLGRMAVYRCSLDPDGWLARFVAAEC